MVNPKTRAVTCLSMAEVRAGVGFGVMKIKRVAVLETDKALNGFVHSGRDLGGKPPRSAGQFRAIAGRFQPSRWLMRFRPSRSMIRIWR